MPKPTGPENQQDEENTGDKGDSQVGWHHQPLHSAVVNGLIIPHLSQVELAARLPYTTGLWLWALPRNPASEGIRLIVWDL
jgi:hypothetical protein